MDLDRKNRYYDKFDKFDQYLDQLTTWLNQHPIRKLQNENESHWIYGYKCVYIGRGWSSSESIWASISFNYSIGKLNKMIFLPLIFRKLN